MTNLPRLLGLSALAGAATGARSLTAVAALARSADRGAKQQPDRTLGRPGVQVTASVLAVLESVTDKLPVTPSRLELPGLAPRIAGAAACGVVIVRRADPAGGAAVAAACALTAAGVGAAAAWSGTRWRALARQWFGHDWTGALIEDAVANTLATAAARAS
jgi:uncharacterized membrane protein